MWKLIFQVIAFRHAQLALSSDEGLTAYIHNQLC